MVHAQLHRTSGITLANRKPPSRDTDAMTLNAIGITAAILGEEYFEPGVVPPPWPVRPPPDPREAALAATRRFALALTARAFRQSSPVNVAPSQADLAWLGSGGCTQHTKLLLPPYRDPHSSSLYHSWFGVCLSFSRSLFSSCSGFSPRSVCDWASARRSFITI